MLRPDKTKSRRIRTVINHIFAGCMFLALLLFRPVNSQEILASSIKVNSESEQVSRILIVAVYDDIVDDRYIMLDYLGSLLRGLDISNTDTILINNSISKLEQDKLFDTAMVEYALSGYKYSSIIALSDKSISYAIEAKRLYYPDADILCFGLDSHSDTSEEYDCGNVISKNSTTNKDENEEAETDENNVYEQYVLVNKTINSALAMDNGKKNNIVVLYDDSDYSLVTMGIIADCPKLNSYKIEKIHIDDKKVKDIDTANSMVFILAYPDNFDKLFGSIYLRSVACCFDLTDELTKETLSFYRPMRYIDVECENNPIVMPIGKVGSKKYMSKDALEKVLLSCVGLDYTQLWGYSAESMNTAQFINYGMVSGGIEKFDNDVKTQAQICIDNDLIVSKEEIVFGNLIFFSDSIYPSYDEVTAVEVYFRHDTVLAVDENGRVICKKPVDEKYHCFYADLDPIVPYNYD